MRALLLDRLPHANAGTANTPAAPVTGVKVANAALVKALLRYGTYDAYYYVRESSRNDKSAAYGPDQRLTGLDLSSLESLRVSPPDELILFTGTQHLAKFVPFRQFCGHPEWPICGMGQVLSSNDLIPAYVWNYFSALGPHDAILCSSNSSQDALRRIIEGLQLSASIEGRRPHFAVRTPLIPLGVELPLVSTTKSNRRSTAGFVVLLIGRFSANHKADLRPLIAAFLGNNELPEQSTLIIAGDDTQFELVPGLEAFAASFNSSRTIVFYADKLVSTKQSLLDMADVALCMSDTYHETFGLSVLDAMAAGLPVVAPDWDGYRDLVVHGETGFLAPTTVCEDTGLINAVSLLIDPAFVLGQRTVIDIHGMLSSLALLAANPDRSRQMGEAGKRRVRDRFTWERIVPQYESLWEELILSGDACRQDLEQARIGFLDFIDVFRSYPTRVLHLDEALVTNDAARFSEAATCARSFAPPPVSGFSDAMDRKIIEACSKYPATVVLDLIEDLSSEVANASMITTQICRLSKYGFLNLHSPDEFLGKDISDDELTDVSVSSVDL